MILSGNGIFEDLRTTLAAQLATTPLLIFFFETYSPISIIANLLVLWTVPPLMIIGGVGAFVSLVVPTVSAPVLWLSIPLLSYFEYVTVLLSRFSSEIRIESAPWALVAGYYLIFLAVILSVYKQRKISL
jgi:competence protein ComEC